MHIMIKNNHKQKLQSGNSVWQCLDGRLMRPTVQGARCAEFARTKTQDSGSLHTKSKRNQWSDELVRRGGYVGNEDTGKMSPL